MYSGGGRRSSMVHKDGNCGKDDLRLCAIVGRSHVLGTEPNAKTATVTESDLPQSYSATLPPPQLDAATNFFSTSNSDNDVLPPFDLVASVALPPAVQCRKFFADLRPLDRILARVVRPGVAVLHVELVCMLSRFRRTLLTFMKGRLVPVPFDRTKRFYNISDYISTTVVSIAPASEELELEIDENEAILTQQGIPAYCRDFDRTTFEHSEHIQSLRDNPNLSAQLGVPLGCARSSGLPSLSAKFAAFVRHDVGGMSPSSSAMPTAQQLRAEQSAKLAMAHVRRGAELTRENKCFEAIQCFNKALNVYEYCADAYVGRGAACAGCRNFPAALADLERAVQLQPNHRNANKYRLEVLHTYAKELERDGKLADARAKFGQLLALCPDHQGALDGIARLDKNDDNIGGTGIELVELSDDEHTDHDDDNGINDGHNGGPLNNSDRRKRRQSENGTNRRHSAAGENGRKSQNGCQTECGAGRAKRRETMSEEEAQRNRQKLAEMEAFIAKLKGAGGGGGGSGGTPKVTGGGSGEKR
ncbi:hypothetical protein niasHS_014048 [Heterodera schachtii]|uniref:Uncharacterized protein n=1 Tax=Heterodera schachtii TaxID=97005 RepID=A0ABD2IQM4_HETSC